MTISNFTKPELDYFRANCNFVNLESNVFEMRASGYTLEYIAEQLQYNISYRLGLNSQSYFLCNFPVNHLTFLSICITIQLH